MKDKWKLIKYYEYEKVELYNLEDDISEPKTCQQLTSKKRQNY